MEFFIGIITWFAVWIVPGILGIVYPEAEDIICILGPEIIMVIYGIVEYKKKNRLDKTFVLVMACMITAVLGVVGAADYESACSQAGAFCDEQAMNEALVLGMFLPGAIWGSIKMIVSLVVTFRKRKIA